MMASATASSSLIPRPSIPAMDMSKTSDRWRAIGSSGGAVIRLLYPHATPPGGWRARRNHRHNTPQLRWALLDPEPAPNASPTLALAHAIRRSVHDTRLLALALGGATWSKDQS